MNGQFSLASHQICLAREKNEPALHFHRILSKISYMKYRDDDTEKAPKAFVLFQQSYVASLFLFSHERPKRTQNNELCI